MILLNNINVYEIILFNLIIQLNVFYIHHTLIYTYIDIELLNYLIIRYFLIIIYDISVILQILTEHKYYSVKIHK
jgi:hypothetical protein